MSFHETLQPSINQSLNIRFVNEMQFYNLNYRNKQQRVYNQKSVQSRQSNTPSYQSKPDFTQAQITNKITIISNSKMEQTRLYHIHLPQSIIAYKQKIVQCIVPYLIYIRNYINQQDNKQAVDPIITIVTVLVVLYAVKTILQGLFGNKSNYSQLNATKQSPELNHQLNDLKKQLKGLKTSFFELAKQLNQTQRQTYQDKSLLGQSVPSANSLYNQLMPLYANSLQNNKKLANYVLQSQFDVLKQLKRLKKHQRQSLSSGRPSTIRSKTSDKKMQSLNLGKSPIKKTTTSSSIKKADNQNMFRSQFHNKNDRRSEEVFFLRPQMSPQPLQKHNNPQLNNQLNGNLHVQTRSKINIQKTIIKTEESYSDSNKNVIQPMKDQSLAPFTNFREQNRKQQIAKKSQLISSDNLNITEETNFQSNAIKISETEFIEEQKVKHTQKTFTSVVQEFQVQQQQLSLETGQNPTTQLNEQEQYQTRNIAPMKLPAMRKPNPPKMGMKRAPPPPPRK